MTTKDSTPDAATALCVATCEDGGESLLDLAEESITLERRIEDGRWLVRKDGAIFMVVSNLTHAIRLGMAQAGRITLEEATR